MIALVVCFLIASPLATLFFCLGVLMERGKQADIYLFPPINRHPSYHHRRTAARLRRQTHLRLVAGVYDWSEDEGA